MGDQISEDAEDHGSFGRVSYSSCIGETDERVVSLMEEGQERWVDTELLQPMRLFVDGEEPDRADARIIGWDEFSDTDLVDAAESVSAYSDGETVWLVTE